MTGTRPKPLPLPRIIERKQVIRLVRYVSALLPSSRDPLRPAVLRLAILLLYTAGLRRGELVRLTREGQQVLAQQEPIDRLACAMVVDAPHPRP